MKHHGAVLDGEVLLGHIPKWKIFEHTHE